MDEFRETGATTTWQRVQILHGPPRAFCARVQRKDFADEKGPPAGSHPLAGPVGMAFARPSPYAILGAGSFVILLASPSTGPCRKSVTT